MGNSFSCPDAEGQPAFAQGPQAPARTLFVLELHQASRMDRLLEL